MDKKLFEDMRSQLSPDEDVVQSVLRRAELSGGKEDNKMDGNRNITSAAAVKGGRWRYIAAAAACAAVAAVAVIAFTRNSDIKADDITPAASGTDPAESREVPESAPDQSRTDDSSFLEYDGYIQDVAVENSSENGVIKVNARKDTLDVVFYARSLSGGHPDKILLQDGWSDDIFAEMYDDGDLENHGDKEAGDGIYSGKYSLSYDFDDGDTLYETNPNERFFTFGAVYSEGEKTHCAIETGITVKLLESGDNAVNAKASDDGSIEDIKLESGTDTVYIYDEHADTEVFFSAHPQNGDRPETISLINMDTGAELAKMYDDGDYENHGDETAGDGYYRTRYSMNYASGEGTILTENTFAKEFRFGAVYELNGKKHTSPETTVTLELADLKDGVGLPGAKITSQAKYTEN